MKALIVYESMFGNTESIARAVAEGMGDHAAVDLVQAAAAPDVLPPDIDLLLVGAPTHAFGLSRPSTRRTASQWGGSHVASIDRGLREWLPRLTPFERPVSVATFDTRLHWPPVPALAARATLRILRAKGGHPAGHRSFWVMGTTGPLGEGQVERARRWGAEVAQSVAVASSSSIT